jgi:hypothetical protein
LQSFCDEQGNSTDHQGLRLQSRDFSYEELAYNELRDEERELVISTRQLCEYLDAAEAMGGVESLGEHSLRPGIKKRKKLKIPPEELKSSNEEKYIEQEKRDAKRIADDDCGYGLT